MIKMIVKICKCHEVDADNCPFIRSLRELGAQRFADSMTEERVVPECSTLLLDSERVS
jgi:hypothetical protein